MALEWQVLIMSIAALLLKMITSGDRPKAVEIDDGPKLLGRSAEDNPRTPEQVLTEES